MNTTQPTIETTVDQILGSPYVLGTRKQENFKIIDIQLPMGWEFPDRLFPENCGIMISQGSAPDVFAIFSESKPFSDIYQKFAEVVRYNQEKEEKLLLLNKMQAELQHLFDELPLSSFKQLVIGRKQSAPTGEAPVKPPTTNTATVAQIPSTAASSLAAITPSTPTSDNGTVLRP